MRYLSLCFLVLSLALAGCGKDNAPAGGAGTGAGTGDAGTPGAGTDEGDAKDATDGNGGY
jgi:hypothetical protein